ncbi:PAS domain-containing sensor histidine kinase [Dictyobacter arantiisoli]|uniref:histidine kinase n=1 Tax=Dictyobacter arantiisoli TaxID=2014874 RepID=A0A5A5TBD5_9CHLR|nr:PAS domain-containing sensor histidine kinase [Dictyobacter arantiisoli]GCF08742.1 hypothetical protein KDI_23060 [Dictyobacter arantiisoli]
MSKDHAISSNSVKIIHKKSDEHQTQSVNSYPNGLETYLGLMMMAHDAMIICDADQHIYGWNPSAERLYGWTQQEVQGKHYHELLQSHTHPDTPQNSVLTLLEQDHWEGELVQTGRDGRTIIVKSKQLIQRNAHGHPTAILLSNQEITRQVRIEQELAREHLVTDQACKAGFWYWDLKTNNIRTTKSALTNTVSVKTFEEYLQAIHPQDRILTEAAARRSLETGENFVNEYRLFTEHGAEHWMHSHGHILYDDQNRPMMMVGVTVDITEQRHLQEQIHEKHHLLKMVLDSIGDGFMALDNRWRFTYVNAQAEKVLEKTSAELLNKHIFEEFPKLKNTQFAQKLVHAVETRQVQHFEFYRSSNKQWFNVHFYPSTEGVTIYYSDVTKFKLTEKKLRHSDAKFNWLANANVVGFMLADFKGRIFEANDLFLSMLGFTRKELEAGLINWRTQTAPEYAELDAQSIRELQATRTFKPFEKEYYDKQGKRVPIMLTGAMVERRTTRCAVIFVDMSAQKELERQKELFMSIIGHELRTPLTAINGSMQLAQRRLQRFFLGKIGNLDPDVELMLNKLGKLLDQSLRQTRVQNRLINDLLDISRLAIDKLELALQPINLITIVRETVEDLRYTEGNHQIDLKLPIQTDIPVKADSDRIGQVIANYITNALKYSSPFEPVTVEVTYGEKLVRVWVHDQGPGLSEEDQKHIWERYYRTSANKNQQAGGVNLGLGLHICQILIQRHGGEVGVISKEGVGSSFWFSLPILKPEEKQTNALEAPTRN